MGRAVLGEARRRAHRHMHLHSAPIKRALGGSRDISKSTVCGARVGGSGGPLTAPPVRSRTPSTAHGRTFAMSGNTLFHTLLSARATLAAAIVVAAAAVSLAPAQAAYVKA